MARRQGRLVAGLALMMALGPALLGLMLARDFAFQPYALGAPVSDPVPLLVAAGAWLREWGVVLTLFVWGAGFALPAGLGMVRGCCAGRLWALAALSAGTPLVVMGSLVAARWVSGVAGSPEPVMPLNAAVTAGSTSGVLIALALAGWVLGAGGRGVPSRRVLAATS